MRSTRIYALVPKCRTELPTAERNHSERKTRSHTPSVKHSSSFGEQSAASRVVRRCKRHERACRGRMSRMRRALPGSARSRVPSDERRTRVRSDCYRAVLPRGDRHHSPRATNRLESSPIGEVKERHHRMLTNRRIAELAEKPLVRTRAAENFLQSLTGTKRECLENLASDAAAYGWNAATYAAIRTGINEAFDSRALYSVRWSHARTSACVPRRVPNARRAASLVRQRPSARRAFRRLSREVSR